MRLNIETTDFDSDQFDKFKYLLEKAESRGKVIITLEKRAKGVLTHFWQRAVNAGKSEITIEEFAEYLQLYDEEEIKDWVELFVKSKYLLPKENGYLLGNKFNDILASKTISEVNTAKVKKRWEDYRKKQLKRLEKSKKESKNFIPAVSEFIPAVSKTDTKHSVFIPNSVQCSTDQIRSDQKIIAPEKKGSQIIKEKYFELFKKEYGFHPSKWGVAENAQAARLAKDENFGVDKTCELLEKFICWKDLAAVKERHPFTQGFGSFIFNLDKLRADILHPESLAEAKVVNAIFEKSAALAAKGIERDAAEAAQKARVLKILNGGIPDYGSACN